MGSGGIDIASLVKAGENPETSGNITSMLESVAKNLGYVEKILGTFEKMGLSPKILEKIVIKYADLDKVPDLPDNRVRGFQPASETHKTVFEAMNSMSESDLKAEMKRQTEAQNAVKKK